MAVTFENVDRIVSSANNVIDLNNLSAGGAEKYIATGSIGAGQTVGLKTDGTVEVITDGTQTFTNSIGTPVVFESDYTVYVSSTFDTNTNKVVITYRDNTNYGYGTAVVGAVSGTAITFGTPVVFNSASTYDTSVIFDSNSNKVVIAYADYYSSTHATTGYGTAIFGTVSGTSITFGTPVVFHSTQISQTSATFDPNSNKVVIAYTDHGNSNYGTSVVGTVSGTSISFGTPAVFEYAQTANFSANFYPNSNKVVIAYRGNSNYGTAIVGTVSGTSISFGSPVVFKNATTTYISATFESITNQVVIAYRDNIGYGNAVVGTVSGTSISFGTTAIFNSAGASNISATFDPNTNQVVIAYKDSGNSGYGTAIVGSVSGTSITFGTPVVFESASTANCSATFDSNTNKVVIAYSNDDNGNYGTATVFQAEGDYTTTNADTWIGIAEESVNSSEAVSIKTVGGVVSGLSGLTIGSEYYVNYDGTLVATENAGVNNGTYGKIGKAISSSKLLITETN